MKRIIIRLVGGFMFSLIGNLSFGQISVKILPLTWVDSPITKGVEIPYSETGSIDLKALSVEDSMDDVNNIPPRFGYPFEVDIDLNDGIWINKNGHLPNVKSESEFVKEGSYSLGERNIKLLEKIEELTLYLIQQQKEIDNLKGKQIDSIEKIGKNKDSESNHTIKNNSK